MYSLTLVYSLIAYCIQITLGFGFRLFLNSLAELYF